MNDTLSPQITITPLAAGRKVIPLSFKNGDIWHTSIKLPDLVVENTGGADTAITQVSILGFSQECHVVTFVRDADAVDAALRAPNGLLNKLAGIPVESPWRAYNLGALFGDVTLTRDAFETSSHLSPGAATCLRLSELVSFLYAGDAEIDAVTCAIKLRSDAGEATVETPIGLTPYRCEDDYIFPIKGPATIMGTPWNQAWGHRMAVSQEFAVDVVDFRRDETGAFALSSPPKSACVDDYYLYHREVLAAAAGTVIAAGNGWPNAGCTNPLEYSEKRVVELTGKLLADGMEFVHAILGNYVILDHHNGEFTLYAHMSEGSVRVVAGDDVAQGDVLGLVGNTSNSDVPHLHFHLMDSGDFITANGLPVMFSNVPEGVAPGFDFGPTNALLYADYLFVHT